MHVKRSSPRIEVGMKLTPTTTVMVIRTMIRRERPRVLQDANVMVVAATTLVPTRIVTMIASTISGQGEGQVTVPTTVNVPTRNALGNVNSLMQPVMTIVVTMAIVHRSA